MSKQATLSDHELVQILVKRITAQIDEQVLLLNALVQLHGFDDLEALTACETYIKKLVDMLRAVRQYMELQVGETAQHPLTISLN